MKAMVCSGSVRKDGETLYTLSNQAGKIDIPMYLPLLPASTLLKLGVDTSGITLDILPILFL